MKKVFFLILVLINIVGLTYSGNSDVFYGKMECNDGIEMPIIAIIPNENKGILGSVKVCIINKKGIFFDKQVDDSTIESVKNAAIFAEKYANKKREGYFISYDLPSEKISGGSSGAAVSSAIISLLTNKKIKPNYLITGKILENGLISEAGGIEEKSKIAVKNNLTIITGKIYEYYLQDGKALARQLNYPNVLQVSTMYDVVERIIR